MRKRQPSQSIALDIGGVCVHLRPEKSARRLGYDTMEALLEDNPALLHYIRSLETGKISEEEYLEAVSRRVFAGVTTQDVAHAMRELLGPEMQGMAELVARMREEGYRVIFLSDISTFHYRCVLERLSFAGLVESAVVSYEVGALKPDPAMYEAFEQRCGGQMPCLYLDDRLCNVEAAEARGWNARHFTCMDDALEAFDGIRKGP